MTSIRGAYKQSILHTRPLNGSPSNDMQPFDPASSSTSSQDAESPAGECTWFNALMTSPMREARAAVLERFEREYVTRLLESCNQNVAEAARRSGSDRATLFRIIRRVGLRSR